VVESLLERVSIEIIPKDVAESAENSIACGEKGALATEVSAQTNYRNPYGQPEYKTPT